MDTILAELSTTFQGGFAGCLPYLHRDPKRSVRHWPGTRVNLTKAWDFGRSRHSLRRLDMTSRNCRWCVHEAANTTTFPAKRLRNTRCRQCGCAIWLAHGACGGCAARRRGHSTPLHVFARCDYGESWGTDSAGSKIIGLHPRLGILAHVNEGDSHCWPLMSERETWFAPSFLFSLRDTFQPHPRVTADRRTRLYSIALRVPHRTMA